MGYKIAGNKSGITEIKLIKSGSNPDQLVPGLL